MIVAKYSNGVGRVTGRGSSQQSARREARGAQARLGVVAGRRRTRGRSPPSCSAQGSAAATAAICRMTSAMLPSPPHWATSRPPSAGRRAQRRRKSASWSAIQWKVAVERTASTCSPPSVQHDEVRHACVRVPAGGAASRAPSRRSVDGDHAAVREALEELLGDPPGPAAGIEDRLVAAQLEPVEDLAPQRLDRRRDPVVRLCVPVSRAHRRVAVGTVPTVSLSLWGLSPQCRCRCGDCPHSDIRRGRVPLPRRRGCGRSAWPRTARGRRGRRAARRDSASAKVAWPTLTVIGIATRRRSLTGVAPTARRIASAATADALDGRCRGTGPGTPRRRSARGRPPRAGGCPSGRRYLDEHGVAGLVADAGR